MKIFYYNRGNFGDVLNPYLIKHLFHIDVEHVSKINQADLFAIGSILEKLPEASDDLTIWGSGFMHAPGSEFTDYWEGPQKFLSVRGKMSASRIKDFDGVLGDPGLLLSSFTPRIAKEYRIGFIPHYVDRLLPTSKKLMIPPDIHYIDVYWDSETFISEVQKCEYIISSSLHGLITADSFHIPNLHVVLSDSVYGKNYKYKDYYSVWDEPHKALDLREGFNKPLNEISDALVATIEENYKDKHIEDIQRDLIKVFQSNFSSSSS